MDEEVVLLEEQLAAASADIERLQSRLAEAEAKAVSREADAAELRRQLESAQREAREREGLMQAQSGEIEALRARLADAETQTQAAAGHYRELALAHEPDLPAELVAGESIAAVEASIVRARQTVAQVRQHLEQQAQAHRVPTGAPVRAAPDLSGLTSAEKIRLGLRQT